jgi:hypothetical protein
MSHGFMFASLTCIVSTSSANPVIRMHKFFLTKCMQPECSQATLMKCPPHRSASIITMIMNASVFLVASTCNPIHAIFAYMKIIFHSTATRGFYISSTPYTITVLCKHDQPIRIQLAIHQASSPRSRELFLQVQLGQGSKSLALTNDLHR